MNSVICLIDVYLAVYFRF